MSNNRFAAYRKGFEFADDKPTASALTPVNFLPQVSGWEPIGSENFKHYNWIASDQLGLLFATIVQPFRIVRRSEDGTWTILNGLEHLHSTGTSLVLLADPTESVGFVIVENPKWGSAVVHRIEGNTIQPAHLILPGYFPEFVGRWNRLCLGLLLAWASHLLIILLGTTLIANRDSWTQYEFGAQQATLASPSRRAVALSIDYLLLVPFVYQFLQYCEGPWKSVTELRRYEFLLHFESMFGRVRISGLLPVLHQILNYVFLDPLRQNQEAVIQTILAMILVFCLKSILEWRWGFTPGKCLLRIRTVRASLRPCSLARILARDLFQVLDVLYFLTPIPAAFSMIYSPCRQRLGDRIADTVVVDAKSIRKVEGQLEKRPAEEVS